ncbi:centrosomal protein of 70 kDa isoform X2 [Clupea harengus]|uniref:Centrosomal protein of 70 kDa n=1 Tax=Clupea harengus TaxID=7950 RepID=A0A6P8EPR8_CLUHA|nr:centrosomal protein of 70 kDa isoform X2 [Clupea harengus]
MEQRELSDWDDINKLLQRHGFKPVQFADPVENKNLSDLVLLEKKAAADIRAMLRTMLADSDRRQALIQELIQSNTLLKEEVQRHQNRAARHSQRASELEGVLDGVKGKVQDLEDRYISKASQQHAVFQQLQQDKKEAESRCEALEQKASQEAALAEQLQRKLYYAVTEEERRVDRQNQAFQQIHKRAARTHSPTDQQVLDVIDVYESQMQQLQNELRTRESDSSEAQHEKTSSDSSSSHKALLKSYQEQLKDTKAQREELRREIQSLKQDLETRPTVKELKSFKQQLKRMDRVLQQANFKSAQDSKSEEATDVENIDHMQASVCRAFLKSACVELGVLDVNQLIPALKTRPRNTDSTRLEKVLRDVSVLLTNPRAPLQLLKQRPNRLTPDQASLPGEFEGILPTLEVWLEQLASLKDLHHSLVKLVKRLLPWQPCEEQRAPAEGVRVEELQLLVDTLLEETAPADKVLCSPTRNTLQSMVAHFQKLFDVSSLRGVYPRMNEVYTRLGEMTNAMRNLRDVLDLDEKAPPSEVVNQVARMASSTEAFATQQMHSLLETNDIDSIILRLKEHEEFFPAFHSLVLELLQTLDVQRMDDIVPALRVLKARVL